jgi:predicted aspartyl protease
VEMLVDTGSAVTLISKDTYRKLKPKPKLKSVGSTLRTADGEAMTLHGQVDLELGLNKHKTEQTVIVAALGGLSGILGLNFLETNRAVVDTGKGILSMSGVDIRLHRENANHCARIRASETVTIPARTEGAG